MLLLATSGRRQLMVLALWDDGKIVVGIFEGGGDGDGGIGCGFANAEIYKRLLEGGVGKRRRYGLCNGLV